MRKRESARARESKNKYLFIFNVNIVSGPTSVLCTGKDQIPLNCWDKRYDHPKFIEQNCVSDLIAPLT